MSVEELLSTLQLPLFDPRTIFPSLETPYSKHSSSNYSAPLSEIPTIREIISQHQGHLNAVDTTIERMESILRQFREKREQLVSSIRAHEGFISCIRRLPSNVLREIFMQCLPGPRERPIIPESESAPLLLTQVCRGWREFALDTPRLWCSLCIEEIGEEPEERVALYHEYWLKNANLSPLALGVDLYSDNTLWITAAIDFVRHYTGRCTELMVRFHQTSSLGRLLEEVPLLECLTLRGDVERLKRETISIVQPHPRLRTLIINSPKFHVDFLSKFDAGWGNLTRLAVSFRSVVGPGDRMFFVLLENCPNLEQFVCSPVRIHKRSNPVSLTHSKLRVLGIMKLYGDGAILDTFMFPNLLHLHVRDFLPDVGTAFEDIPMLEQSLLNGSGNRAFNITGKTRGYISQAHTLFTVFSPGWTEITHLNLTIKQTEDFVPVPLQLCPNLREIAFSSIDVITSLPNVSVTHPTLCSLTIRLNVGPVATILDMLTLPNLHHLDLTLPESPDWPHETFKQFLLRSQCQLETIKINGPRILVEEREEFSSLMPTLTRLDLSEPTESLSDTDSDFFSEAGSAI